MTGHSARTIHGEIVVIGLIWNGEDDSIMFSANVSIEGKDKQFVYISLPHIERGIQEEAQRRGVSTGVIVDEINKQIEAAEQAQRRIQGVQEISISFSAMPVEARDLFTGMTKADTE